MGHGAGIIQEQYHEIHRFPTSRIRTGKIIWCADFDEAVEMYPLYGTVSIINTAGQVIRGKSSLKLETAATIDAVSQALKYLSPEEKIGVAKNKIGIEFLWSAEDTNVKAVLCTLIAISGAEKKVAGIKWLASTKNYQLRDSTGVYQNILGAIETIRLDKRKHNHFKATFDLENRKYSKLHSNGNVYDLSAYDLGDYTVDELDDNVIIPGVAVQTGAAVAVVMWVDDMIITDTEP